MKRYFKLGRKRPLNVHNSSVDLYRPEGRRWLPSVLFTLLLTIACYGSFQLLSGDSPLLGPLESHLIYQTSLGQPS